MKTFGQTIGEAITEAADERIENVQVVSAFKIKTITGFLGAVKFMFGLIGTETVELSQGVKLKLGPHIKATFVRSKEEIKVFFEPGPQLILDLKITRVKPQLTGIILRRDELELKLDGLPDVKIGLK